MATISELPLPRLSAGRYTHIDALTDDGLFDKTGIRIAFTGRAGGISGGPFAALNLSSAVGDDPEAVSRNRNILKEDLGFPGIACIVPNQVHGDTLVRVEANDPASLEAAQRAASEGADGIIVDVDDAAALLCFADCVPVVIASPTASFAVVHAGWRGVENGIVVKAAKALAKQGVPGTEGTALSSLNVYIGPHIWPECFETSPDVHERFTDAFGWACAMDDRHIDLGAALRISLEAAGVDAERIVEAESCTVCDNDRYFSYRAQNGTCGRQGAFAVRQGVRP